MRIGIRRSGITIKIVGGDIKMSDVKGFDKLFELMSESPGLRVVPLVHSDVVTDLYGSHFGRVQDADYDEIFDSGDHVYLRSEDEDDLEFNRYYLLASEDPPETEADRARLMEIAKDDVRAYNWEKVIVVYIHEYENG